MYVECALGLHDQNIFFKIFPKIKCKCYRKCYGGSINNVKIGIFRRRTLRRLTKNKYCIIYTPL